MADAEEFAQYTVMGSDLAATNAFVTQESLALATGVEAHLIQGKVAELRLELNSGGKKDKNHSAKKMALKKIVANMTMSNNDMIALFPDVVGCMQIPSLEIKKMWVLSSLNFTFTSLIAIRCFLFLVNYARIKPDVALKALPVLIQVRQSGLRRWEVDLTLNRTWRTRIL